MASTLYLLNSPLINYFHYKSGDEIGELLADGKIYFWEDENHTIPAPTYSDPNGTVVNTNPIDLSVVGSCPPIYMEDRLYFIEIYDSEGKAGGNLIESLDGYIPNGNSSQEQGGTEGNLLANPQFNYPIAFYKSSDPIGRINLPATAIAYGWEYLCDNPATTGASINTITFFDVSNDKLPGNPRWECTLNSTTGTVTETVKDFRQILGEVNILAGEQITFTIEGRALTSGTQEVQILFEKFYGKNGSETLIETITTFSFSSSRTQFSYVYTVPKNTGKTIDEGNYIAIRIRGSLNQTVYIGFTNLGLFKGNIADPVIGDTSGSIEKSQIVGESIQIEDTSLNDNYSRLIYHDGKIVPVPLTGQIEIVPVNHLRADQVLTDGAPYLVADYHNNIIPYRRLFNIIGTDFGTGGGLEVTAKDSTVIFSSGVGARQSSDYTNGNTGTAITVVNTEKGQKADVNCSLKIGTDNVIVVDWIEQFSISTSPNPGPGGATWQPKDGTKQINDWYSATSSAYGNLNIGPDPFTIVDVVLGTPSVYGQSEIQINSSILPKYYLPENKVFSNQDTQYNFIDWPTLNNNVHSYISNGSGGPYKSPGVSVYFSVDKVVGPQAISGLDATIEVPILSTDGTPQIIRKFINAVNNPFIWTFTIVSVPAASTYCFYSVSSSTLNPDRYFWFEVDSVGSDPGPFTTPTRATAQGTKIAISSTDSPSNIASKIALALNDLSFNVPDASDVPILPSSFLTHAINL